MGLRLSTVPHPSLGPSKLFQTLLEINSSRSEKHGITKILNLRHHGLRSSSGTTGEMLRALSMHKNMT
jgi:hypothetical protein